jgi:predicted outer membrane repeat protein
MSKHVFSNLRHLLTGLAVLGLGSGIGAASAATLTVPAQYPTIQAGITAAQPGDTVLIAGGTYSGKGNYNLDFGGKAITVASQNGAAKTILDVQYLGQGVLFHSGETAAAKLQGLTIKSGFSGDGAGGVAITGSSPTVSGCVFVHNYSNDAGGGLSATKTANPTVTGCAFTSNYAVFDGGGLFLEGSGTVTGCTFTSNSTGSLGGGLALGEVTLVGAVVSSCIFSGNAASSGSGGGLFAGYEAEAVSVILSCVFVGNTAKNSGGGIYGQATVTNCTTSGNTALAGSGVSLIGSLTNSILYADNGPEIDSSGGILAVTYCDLVGGHAGAGNVSLDPQFVRSPALTATPADYGDLHLRTGSPLVHIGTSAGAPATDADGAVRPPTPSIGAYEIGPAFLPDIADSYIQSNAPAQNFGSDPTLSVGGFLGAAHLKFDLSSLGVLTTGSTVKLHLNAGLALAGIANLAISATGTNWTEGGLTFQNRPQAGRPLTFLDVTAGGPGSAPYDVDLTSYVKAQQTLGTTQIGLALTQYGFGLPVSIDSKENAVGDGPQLIVTY